MALIPVAFLPPWVKISHLLAPIFFTSIAMTMHCDPNLIELSFIKLWFFTAAVLIETLSAPASSRDIR